MRYLVFFCLCSPALGQFQGFDGIAFVRAGGVLDQFNIRDPVDRAVGDARGSAWVRTAVGEDAFSIAGGTSELSWLPGQQPVSSEITARVQFSLDSPDHIHIHYELTIDPNRSDAWTGLGTLSISDGGPFIGASVGNTVAFVPNVFEVGEDGMARMNYDGVFSAPQGNYLMTITAISRCGLGASNLVCDGQPITYSARIIAMPEPSTWIILSTGLPLAAWRLRKRLARG